MILQDEQLFHQGAIPAGKLAGYIQHWGGDHSTGAFASFLGQVRADLVNNEPVTAIEYTAYETMAEEKMQEIATEVQQQYGLNALQVKHSLGLVRSGEICLMVITASAHRKAAIEGCNELVERVKKELPIWGKEITGSANHQWKINQ
ncbi:MAG: molybdenum cofactor biosynthesis protein MoaE [Chitinophagaceae bacterium]